MLRSIQKLIGDKRKQLIFPVFLMSLDAIGSLVMYLMLYFTVIHLLNGSLTGGLVRNYNRKRVSAVLRDRCFEAQADCSFARTGLFRSRDSHNS